MILTIQLNAEEYGRWADPIAKEQLLERCAELARGDDIDRVIVRVDSLHQIELAPASHAKQAERLRELGMGELASLVDPKLNPNVELRSKFADQLVRYGMQYKVSSPEPT